MRVRTIKYIGILVTLLAVCGSVSARPLLRPSQLSPDYYHSFGFWGGASYSTLLSGSDLALPGHGASPIIGGGYRYSRNGFLLTLGLEGQFSYLNNRIADKSFTRDMVDTQGEPFTMHARFDDCKDVVKAAFVNLPVLFGGDYDLFYAQAGMVLQYNVWASTSSRNAVTTEAVYEDLIGPFGSMPNHQLYDRKETASGDFRMRMNFNLLLHAEAGLRVDRFLWKRGYDVHNHDYRIYLGAFAQYGLLNCRSGYAQGSLLTYDEVDGVLVFSVVPALLANELHSTAFHPLNVGIKLSCFFELPKPAKCVICREGGSRRPLKNR